MQSNLDFIHKSFQTQLLSFENLYQTKLLEYQTHLSSIQHPKTDDSVLKSSIGVLLYPESDTILSKSEVLDILNKVSFWKSRFLESEIQYITDISSMSRTIKEEYDRIICAFIEK